MGAGVRRAAGFVFFAMLAATAPDALGAWSTVKVVVQDSDGDKQEIVGSKIAYGYFKREFTPNGVKDRLRVEKSLVFADRDVRFPDLRHIKFEHERDGTTGLQVPTVMHITFEKRKDEVVELDRDVSELQGFGNPKPVVLIVTTKDGKVQVDLTPAYDQEARADYRPVLEILFE